MNFPRFLVDKPIFGAVLSIIILVAGLISIARLPLSEYPEGVPPSVVVRAQYPGANPKVIAGTVAAPLEEQINGAEGRYGKSPSGRPALRDNFRVISVSIKTIARARQ